MEAAQKGAVKAAQAGKEVLVRWASLQRRSEDLVLFATSSAAPARPGDQDSLGREGLAFAALSERWQDQRFMFCINVHGEILRFHISSFAAAS